MEARNKFGALNCKWFANKQSFGHLGKCCETRSLLGRSAFVLVEFDVKITVDTHFPIPFHIFLIFLGQFRIQFFFKMSRKPGTNIINSSTTCLKTPDEYGRNVLTKHHNICFVWKEIQVSCSRPETRWYAAGAFGLPGLDCFDVVFAVDTEARQKLSQLCKTKNCVCSTKHCSTLTRKTEIEKVFIHNQQTTAHRKQPTNNKQPTTNNKQQTTNKQQPTTNNQQTTNNKQQTTNNKQPTTNKQ